MEISNTLKYINLVGVSIGLVALCGPIHRCPCVSVKHGDGEGLGHEFQKKPMNLCVGDSEERECVVGVDVTDTMISETPQVVGFVEVVRTVIRFRKKPMNFCACDIEESECGVMILTVDDRCRPSRLPQDVFVCYESIK